MASHWRTARDAPGVQPHLGPPHGARGHSAELIAFPSGSLLEPVEVSEPPVHKFSVVQSAALSVITAAAFLFAIVILLFVEVQ